MAINENWKIKCRIKDLSKAFEHLKIIQQLEEHVNSEKSILGIAIKEALKRNEPAINIFKTIKSQAFDNRKVVEEVISKKLTDIICALKF